MEVSVADQMNVDEVLTHCDRYWRATGVGRAAIDDMRRELESHLREAAAAGKAPSEVVGPDLDGFAESWAAVERGPRRKATWAEVRSQGRESRGWAVWAVLFIAIIATLAWIGPKEDSVDDIELWRWIWLGAAVVLGIGEMVTAGLFMLPFAIGALAAALLAFFNIDVWVQITAFLLVSVAALWGMRKFAWREGEPSHPVGAKRYEDAIGTVTETVDRVAGTGRVRVETEHWRATTDLDATIATGTEVQVVDVRGARLVVEPRS